MNTNYFYIDVTNSIPDEIPKKKNICFVYMPYLNYKSMDEAEQAALDRGYAFMNLPITLPMLDLIKQMEFVGIEITEKLLQDLPANMRLMVIEKLNAGS
mgnify:CR=1 FL=1